MIRILYTEKYGEGLPQRGIPILIKKGIMSHKGKGREAKLHRQENAQVRQVEICRPFRQRATC